MHCIQGPIVVSICLFLFCVIFVQYGMFTLINFPSPAQYHFDSKCIFAKRCCAKRASKTLVTPKDLKLSVSIGKFLTNYHLENILNEV